jgi:hypothetical protein
MSDRRRASGYRDAKAAPRRGLLDSLFAPRAPLASMPKVRIAIARGVALVATTPIIAVGVVVFVGIVWFALVVAGYRGSLYDLLTVSAIAPLGSFGDAAIARSLFGAVGSQAALIALVVVRGVLTGLLAGIATDALRGRASRWSLVRGARAIPAGVLASVLAFMVAFVASTTGLLLGAAFGQLAQLGAPLLGIYLFGFAPAIAADEGSGATAAIAKGVRAARMPGGGNVLFAATFVLLVIVLQILPALVARSAGSIGANPALGTWAYVLAANLVQVGMFVAICYRYLSIAEEVPEPQARRPARRR